ncbi:DUF4870 domain-containing protein [Sinomicrobium soli]|uniref:DUF4870 domain-containing protein n=1 Tax=Sinomicrobium sp. N-1-3-6 TaxID=2219864 RepID=UPI000DCDA0E3|nr:DUF4870 domain-containing protein [Sinomicrobium sp. N-1-3-6]RAV29032.1 DUF4870 domain-containing protein [Sinomicrobium sp. N-1-3-6]
MNPKTQSIISYLGIFWLIAYFGGKNERNDFSTYHLKQGLGLLLLTILFNVAVVIISMVSPSLGGIIGYAGILFLLIMVIGIINAANEVKKPLPLAGRMFENKFPFLDKE